jgi:hypothetical protein
VRYVARSRFCRQWLMPCSQVPPQYGFYTAIVMTPVGALLDSSRQQIPANGRLGIERFSKFKSTGRIRFERCCSEEIDPQISQSLNPPLGERLTIAKSADQ